MIIDQAYAEDASGELTFAQARKLPLTQFKGTLLKGYTRSTFWVRVRIIKTSEQSELNLTVEPQFLDEVALYDPRQPDAPPVITGDRHPGAELDAFWHGNAFRVQQQTPQQEYWLRIRSTSAMIVSLQAALHDALHFMANATHRIMDTYTGIMLVFLLWAAGMLITQRGDRVILAFFLQQLSSLCLALSYYGYLRYWFSGWPGASLFDFTTSLFIITTTATTIHFHYVLLATSRPHAKLLKLLKALCFPIAASFALLAMGRVQWAIQLNMIIITAGPFIMLAVACSIGSGPARGDMLSLPRFAMVFYYILFLLLMSAIGLSALGLLQIGFFLDYRAITLLSVVLVVAFLQWRAWHLDRMRLRITVRNNQLRQKLHHRRRKMDEQSQLMSMLAHELKTPLSIMRIATAMSLRSAPLQQHTEKAILDISTIIDRCTKAFALEQADSTPVQPAPCNVVEELEELRANKNTPRILISGSGPQGFATDKGLLRVIAGNLIDNALKYGDPEKPLTIRITPAQRKPANGVAIEFSNAPGNAGYPDPDKLFEKFYRAPAAQRESGAGLGLYIVQGVCKTLGGTIEYSPSPQHIRFNLWLPSLA